MKKKNNKKNSEVITCSEYQYIYEERNNPHNDKNIEKFLLKCQKELAKDDY